MVIIRDPVERAVSKCGVPRFSHSQPSKMTAMTTTTTETASSKKNNSDSSSATQRRRLQKQQQQQEEEEVPQPRPLRKRPRKQPRKAAHGARNGTSAANPKTRPKNTAAARTADQSRACAFSPKQVNFATARLAACSLSWRLPPKPRANVTTAERPNSSNNDDDNNEEEEEEEEGGVAKDKEEEALRRLPLPRCEEASRMPNRFHPYRDSPDARADRGKLPAEIEASWHRHGLSAEGYRRLMASPALLAVSSTERA